ncbi:phosphate/phosphite/phosphonate ABC transporter substrate-binding protein [Calditerrivibrio nitroreducens]|uniref:phosphate/phosphite/phosphonate ABC transporter substrate-binding protein n=1 Tax=Calditerrivibrio nitroreducens TaxID=477976 RepID=UPI003C788243
MGVFPYSNPQKVVTDYPHIAEKISKDLGCKVKIYTATTYEEYMNKASNLEYDIFVPCVSCIVKLVTNKVPLEVIAAGYPPFKGAVIVRHDSKIDSLNKLKGIKIAAVVEHSFGGYLFLKYNLQSMGIDIQRGNFVSFVGKTDNVLISVLNGKADVGVTRLDVLNEDIYLNVRKDLKVIYESDPILNFPFVVSKSMDKELKLSIKQSLFSYIPDKSNNSLKYEKIIETTSEDYVMFAKKHGIKSLFKPHFKGILLYHHPQKLCFR